MAYKYKRIRLSRGVTRDRHRLLVESILGRRLGSNEIVHHRNEVPRDDSPGNLLVVSRGEHCRMHFQGSKAPWAKLNEEKVAEIKQLLSSRAKPQRAIAREYGVSKAAICDIAAGRSWTHV